MSGAVGPHGDASTYGNHGCRCQPCTSAHAERSREYRNAAKARRDALQAKRALKAQHIRDVQAEVQRRYRDSIQAVTP
jgi:hypothetical protein